MIAQSGQILPIEITYIDPGLFVQAEINDVTTGTRVFVQDLHLAEYPPGSYVGYFSPIAGKSYYVIKRVFTDGTYTTVDPNYAPSTLAVQCVNVSGGGGGSSGPQPSIRGIVGCSTQPIVGIVGAAPIIGIVQDF